MLHTEDPQPREGGQFTEYVWPVVESRPYNVVKDPPQKIFVEVFEGRRSTRSLEPAKLELTINALHFALAPRFWKVGDELRRSRRPSLSAGALHAISVLLVHDSSLFRLNAQTCMLEELAISHQTCDAWTSRCQRLLPAANGTWLIFVADMARPISAYAHSETLVWRDAGAMLQTLGLAAELFGLGFCPLGILGSEITSALPSGGNLLALGAAVLGMPSTN